MQISWRLKSLAFRLIDIFNAQKILYFIQKNVTRRSFRPSTNVHTRLNNYHLDNSLMLVTALAPHIGYDNSAKIAKLALKNKTTLKHEALKSKLINEKDYNRIVDPKKMIYPA